MYCCVSFNSFQISSRVERRLQGPFLLTLVQKQTYSSSTLLLSTITYYQFLDIKQCIRRGKHGNSDITFINVKLIVFPGPNCSFPCCCSMFGHFPLFLCVHLCSLTARLSSFVSTTPLLLVFLDTFIIFHELSEC